MALSEKVKAAQAANGGASAPAAPAASASKAKDSDSKVEAFRQHGAAIRAQMTDDQKAMEGSKSDKVAFVCALGDPNHRQDRVSNQQTVRSYYVVGYTFKALEDMTIPFAPYKQGMKSFMDVEAPTEKQVKAGEEFSLNLAETGMLISRVEYAGRFTGEGTGVYLTAKGAADRPTPNPILNKTGTGSIKENMVFVADMVGAGDGKKGTPKIKPEYEANFGGLYTRRSIGGKSTAAKKEGANQADLAAAFRSFYSQQ